jgi:hypothetical protein
VGEVGYTFRDVFASELLCVKAHRELNGIESTDALKSAYEEAEELVAGKQTSSDSTLSDDDENVSSTKYGLVGMSLSGGGIRSASVCLGVLQALEAKWQLIRRIDFLSTVSGGGYFGSSLAVGLSKNGGLFPFPSELGGKEDVRIGHLRDYSNYLVAGSFRNVLEGVGAIFIGLVANTLLVLPILLLAAGVTIFFNPTKKALTETHQFAGFFNILDFQGSFAITLNAVVLSLALSVLIIVAGYHWKPDKPASRIWRRTVSGFLLFLPLLIAFFELQPAVVDWYSSLRSGGGTATSWLMNNITVALGAVSAFMAGAGSWITKLLKFGEEGSGWTALLSKIAGKVLYLIAGLAVPVFLWFVYLTLCRWGIMDGAGGYSGAPVWLQGFFMDLYSAPPAWIGGLSEKFEPWRPEANVAAVYFEGFLALSLISFLISPNAYTLYFLYRDRLAKGFIDVHDVGARAKGQSLKFKLSSLSEKFSPVLLINAALNIRSDREFNRRGRHADFFTFGRNHCGSKSTGYCRTSDLEDADNNLDVATAMAISGAAASANMGNKTRKLFVFSLALLNIRLGYWLPNPHYVWILQRSPELAAWFSSIPKGVRKAFSYITPRIINQLLAKKNGRSFCCSGNRPDLVLA